MLYIENSPQSVYDIRKKYFNENIYNTRYGFDFGISKIFFRGINPYILACNMKPIITIGCYPIYSHMILFKDVYVGCINYHEINETSIYIYEYGIIEEFRGLGLGIKVMDLFIGAMYKMGVRQIELEADNSELFWNKFGFEKTKIQNNRPYMVLKINE